MSQKKKNGKCLKLKTSQVTVIQNSINFEKRTIDACQIINPHIIHQHSTVQLFYYSYINVGWYTVNCTGQLYKKNYYLTIGIGIKKIESNSIT